MPRSGRPKAVLVLTDEEREQLSRWTRRAKSSQALALRSRIVLACAEGVDNKTVAAQMGCSPATVGKWRARFVQDRLDGLVDEPRPGRPPTITVDQVEEVPVATLESTPANATHWTRAKMAQRALPAHPCPRVGLRPGPGHPAPAALMPAKSSSTARPHTALRGKPPAVASRPVNNLAA